ncbi:MAG: hypothetical protein M1826_000710 [Phylliscum demangeonii]|nr:MAG: hypothetical protein M1826_000710 [Phylliscum demangeonii]
MSTIAIRSTLAQASRRAGVSTGWRRAAGLAGTSFIRTKATLPDLPYDFGALEPAISGQIMELHYKKHHATYVKSYNEAAEKYASAESASDIRAQVALLPLINFHGGGHLNHSLFWENLAPQNAGGGRPPTGPLKDAIESTFGGLDAVKTKFNAALAAIMGSGWAWLVKDRETGQISIRTYSNQDPVTGQFVPLLGIDAWEHAY